jgi:hypothetical protein
MVMLHELFHCYEAYNKNRGKLADIMIYSPIDNSRDLKWYENRKQLYVLLQKLNINIHWLFRIAAPASPWLTTVNPSPDIIFRFPSAKMLACAFNRCHNSQVLFLELKTCTLDLSLQRQVWSALLFWDSVKSRRRLNILSLSASSFSFIMRRRRWSQRKTKANSNHSVFSTFRQTMCSCDSCRACRWGGFSSCISSLRYRCGSSRRNCAICGG